MMDEWWFKDQVNELRQPHGICIIIDLHGFYIRERQFVNRNLSADGSIVIMVFMSVSTWPGKTTSSMVQTNTPINKENSS